MVRRWVIMKLLFICRDGLEDSLLSTVAMATEARKTSDGDEVGILFTGEAVAALAGQSFDWSPLLRDWGTRMLVSRNATEMGYPLANPRDIRWTKPRQLLPAAREAGVRLIACPLWSKLLGVEDKLPEELERPDMAALIQELRQSDKVIGSF